jgi:glutaredoxin 3
MSREVMQPVTIYTKFWCAYSRYAKALLERKGVDFTEIDIAKEPLRRAEMLERSGGRSTVPQVFIGSTHVGGCDELCALDAKGKLEPLLAGALEQGIVHP